jgi:hypothetical protein
MNHLYYDAGGGVVKVAALAGILVMLMVCAPPGLFAEGKGDAQSSAQENPEVAELPEEARIIRGMVRVWGNEPHTYAGIETSDGKHYAVFPDEKEKEIRDLQGNLVEFTVVFSEKPQGYGSLFLRDGSVTPLSWRTFPGADAISVNVYRVNSGLGRALKL